MNLAEGRLAPAPGSDGLVCRSTGAVLFVGARTPVADVSRLVEEVAGHDDPTPGRHLARHLAALLGADDVELPPFALVAASPAGVYVRAYGPVEVHLNSDAGEEVISAVGSVTGVDRELAGPFHTIVAHRAGEPAPAAAFDVDLKAGTTTGSGFALTTLTSPTDAVITEVPPSMHPEAVPGAPAVIEAPPTPAPAAASAGPVDEAIPPLVEVETAPEPAGPAEPPGGYVGEATAAWTTAQYRAATEPGSEEDAAPIVEPDWGSPVATSEASTGADPPAGAPVEPEREGMAETGWDSPAQTDSSWAAPTPAPTPDEPQWGAPAPTQPAPSVPDPDWQTAGPGPASAPPAADWGAPPADTAPPPVDGGFGTPPPVYEPPTGATPAYGTPAPTGFPEPATLSPTPVGDLAGAAFSSHLLGALDPDEPENREALPVDMDPAEVRAPEQSTSEVLVQGVICSRGHFNDPRSRFCSSCGIGMVQNTQVLTRGPRPPLGVMVFEDGATFSLSSDYVVGRQPEVSDLVRDGLALPLPVDDPERSISRAHAELRLVEWDVHLVNLSQTNGSFVWDEIQQQWVPIPPGQSVMLTPGMRVALGRRSAVFESSLVR